MNVGVVAITETWFMPDSDLLAYTLHGFSQFVKSRYGKRGGGVMLCIDSKLCPTVLFSSSTNSSFDVVAVKFFSPAPTFITLVYRPPDCSPADTLQLQRVLGDLLDEAGVCNSIVLGDFNLPHICWDNLALTRTHGIHDSFHEFFLCRDLYQLVQEPTRGDNLLDIILTSHPVSFDAVTVEPPIGNSDHDSVTFKLLHNTIPTESSHDVVNSPCFDFVKADFVAITNALIRVDWQDLFSNCLTIDQYWANFYEVIVRVITAYVPVKKFRFKTSRPRLPRHVLQLINRKRRAWRLARCSPTAANKRMFKWWSGTLRNAIRAYRVSSDTAALCGVSTKRFYHAVSKRLNPPKESFPILDSAGLAINDDSVKAEAFNEAFIQNFADAPQV